MLIENKYVFLAHLFKIMMVKVKFLLTISYINYLKMIKSREKIIYFSKNNLINFDFV